MSRYFIRFLSRLYIYRFFWVRLTGIGSVLLWVMDTRLQILKTTYKSHIRGQYEASAVSYKKNKGVEMQKKFYITELHLGDDGLESTTDHSGPFTLKKARSIMERIMKGNDPWMNPYAMGIRGPRHFNKHGFNTEFYSHKEDRWFWKLRLKL